MKDERNAAHPRQLVTDVMQTRTRGNVPMTITLLSHTKERRVSCTEHSDSLSPAERQDVGPGLAGCDEVTAVDKHRETQARVVRACRKLGGAY